MNETHLLHFIFFLLLVTSRFRFAGQTFLPATGRRPLNMPAGLQHVMPPRRRRRCLHQRRRHNVKLAGSTMRACAQGTQPNLFFLFVF